MKPLTQLGGLISRRSVFKLPAGAAMLGAGAHFGFVASAKAEGVAAQAPGYFRFNLGDMAVTILSDGNLLTPASMIGANATDEERTNFLESRALDTGVNYAHTNHVLLDTGAKRILIDVGSGDKFQPSAGKLLQSCEAAGIDPESVDILVITHAHPDHCWGMMDDFGDEMRFPNAEVVMMGDEFDWWTAEERVSAVPVELQAFVVGAQNALKPVAENIRMLKDGEEVAPGVTMIAAPGHTLSHAAVLIESAGAAMLVAGDAINHAYASFEKPEWHFGFDMDREQAVATRKRLLDMAATDKLLFSAYHLPFPGVGRVIRDGDAYRFLPSVWRWS